MTQLRREFEQLLEASRSEAKRWGTGQVDLLTLASALAVKWPEEFASAFAEEDRGALERQLAQGAQVGSEADVLQVMQAADGTDPVSTLALGVRERLSPYLTRPTEGADADSPAAETLAVGTPATGGSAGDGAAASEPADAVEGWAIPARSARFISTVEPRSALARESAVDALVIALASRLPGRLPTVVGEQGSGRSTVLAAVAERLATGSGSGDALPVVRIDPSAILLSGGADSLLRVLEDLEGDVVVAIDDLDLMARLGSAAPDLGVLTVLLAAVRAGKHRLIATIDSQHLSRIGSLESGLGQAIRPVELDTLPAAALSQIVRDSAAGLSADGGVSYDEDALVFAEAPRLGADLRGQPGLAHDRLTEAAARARLRGDTTVTVAHMGNGQAPEMRLPDRVTLADRLRLRVVGQDSAVETVSGRFALTRAKLDLRPERPDGVFLFVGPTGVGKTELARAIAVELYGSESALIRLDMSEYSHDWAVSRLVGPMPGYVGSTEPDSWLTTRVAKRPHCVVLLDEIEKSHPTVWNTFLQVFDAGRLSDSRGVTADFSNVVIIMTSNLGAQAFTDHQLGFGGQADSGPGERGEKAVLDSVKRAMAPELVNRLDALVPFRPLSPDAIRDVARKEISDAVDRLQSRGYRLSVDGDVIDLIAEAGYDPAYGARHLQRNIEKILLEPLADAEGRDLTAYRTGDIVGWKSAGS